MSTEVKLMRVPDVAGLRCNWCSRVYPAYRVHRLRSNQVICENCIDWNNNAHAFIGGAVPAGCQVCHKTWADLNAEYPGEMTVKIYVVQKDGILQMLCESCITPYTDKRRDLYEGTKFWTEKKAA